MAKDLKFVGLHAHSGFSIGDGFGKPQEHMEFAFGNGCDALALTDHGHMNGFPHQYLHGKSMKGEGRKFKAIYGFEGYFHPDLKQWQFDRQKAIEDKKFSEDKNTVILENEEESKKKWFDPVKRRHHLVVLAQNQVGLQNIFTIVSRAYNEGMYRYPRFDFNMLKEHGEGIIISTACLGGPFCYEIFLHQEESYEQIQAHLKNLLDRFRDVIPPENFYLEVQFNRIPEQALVNYHIMELARSTGTPLVATADSHYPSPEKWKAREIYKRLAWQSFRDYKPGDLPEERKDLSCELYPKNGNQMWEEYLLMKGLFPDKYKHIQCDNEIRIAIENSWHIAHDVIGDVHPDTSTKIYSFTDRHSTSFQKLKKCCLDEMTRRGLADQQCYIDRLVIELEVIKDREFSDYFLCYKRAMDAIKNEMLCGPGRGSGAGSLVNYLLNITEIDPVKHNLLFERFISRFRKGYPDIDSDVADKERAVAILRREFGYDNVITISNYNTLQLKSLMKDISRFFGIDFAEINRITQLTEKEVKNAVLTKGMDKNTFFLTYDLAEQNSQTFQEFIKKYPEVAEHVKNLFQQIRAISRHAGGVLIYDKLTKHMPVIKIRGECQSPWTEGLHYKHLPELGFIKFDILALETLRIVENAIKLILKSQGKKDVKFADVREYYETYLHPDIINTLDQKVYKNVYKDGKFPAIFQFTQDGAQRFVQNFLPENIIDIAAATSIYRPGPLAANVDKMYLNRKSGKEEFTYEHPAIEKVLGNTYGFLVFQEQMMSLAHELAGMDLNDCDRLRKAIVKKSIGTMDKIAKERSLLHKQFVEGAVSNGLDRDSAEKWWKDMEFFSGYAFNLSHALSYAFDSFMCAWLFTYFEKEWLCAYMETYSQKNDVKCANALSEVKSLGYKIKMPDINYAGHTWTIVNDDTLMSSLSTVKFVGEAAIDELIEMRPITSLVDLLWEKDLDHKWGWAFRPRKLNKRCIDSLIKIKAFDSLDIIGDEKPFKNYAHLRAVLVEHWDKFKKKKGPMLLPELIKEYQDIPAWTRDEQIEFLESLFGSVNIEMILSDELEDKLNKLNVFSISNWDPELDVVWFIIKDIKVRKTKRGKPFAKLKVMGAKHDVHWITYWGYHPEYDRNKLVRNSVFAGRLKYEEQWGYSTHWGRQIQRVDDIVASA